MVAQELAWAEYNARRAECEAGVRALVARFPEIRALRDATVEQLDAIGGDVTPQVWRRCRHVITENDRVVRAAAALTRSDFVAFGALMGASHASLRDDYEVSCSELDRMAGIAADLDGVFGARMTGAGFGGCAIALVDARAADARLRETIRQRYYASTGIRADVWICGAGGGVEKITEGLRNTEKKTRQGDTEPLSSSGVVPMSTHPHRRLDPLRNEWVIVSPHRNDRPWQGQVDPPAIESQPSFDPGCYLCPGNARANGARNPAYTS